MGGRTETVRGAGPDSEAALLGALWRGVDAYRVLSLLYAVYLAGAGRDEMAHPMVAVVVLGVYAVWSLALLWWRPRNGVVLGIELALACAGILLTPLARGGGVGGGTIPALWAATPVMGWAVLDGLAGGLLAAIVISACDVIEIGTPTEGTVYNIVTIVLIGACLGACIGVARRTLRALEVAIVERAEAVERERLARTIHDGVLQALAFIHRRGDQIGGEAADLGRLAAEQEARLRSLALGPSRRAADAPADAPVDLRAAFARLGGPTVTVSTPAEAVTMPDDRAGELVAAVEAALANVERHAGPQARAWVLVEDLGDVVVITVRDDGRGYPPGRLEQARAQGRLGVASSIDGRVRDLGGSVQHRSTPGLGTTVEMTVPVVATGGHPPGPPHPAP